MNEPVEHPTTKALLALRNRPISGRVVGAALVALALWGLFALTNHLMGFGLPPGVSLGAAGLVAVFLEWRILAEMAPRVAQSRALAADLIGHLGDAGEPSVAWRRGLPFVRGRVESGRFAAYFDVLRPAGLRLNLTLEAEPGIHLVVVGEGEGLPIKWLAGLLERRHRRLDIPGMQVLTPEAERAQALLTDRSWQGDATQIVGGNPPYATVLDFDGASVGLDTRLAEIHTGSKVLEWVAAMGDLAERLRAMVPETSDGLEITSGDVDLEPTD